MASTPRLKKSTDFIPYSPSEERIFALLPFASKWTEGDDVWDGAIDTEKLTRKYYKNKKIPMNGRVIVAGTLRKLMKKVESNKEPYHIRRTPRAGPHSIAVWVVKR